MIIKKDKSLLGFIAVMIIFLIWAASLLHDEKAVHEKIKKYPVKNKGDLIRGIITDKEVSTTSSDRGVLYLELNKQNKLRLITQAINYSYHPEDLGCFLQVGDSIYKNNNNDTIRVCRGRKMYYFILDQTINYK